MGRGGNESFGKCYCCLGYSGWMRTWFFCITFCSFLQQNPCPLKRGWGTPWMKNRWGRGARRKDSAGFEATVLEGQAMCLWLFDAMVYCRVLVPSLELECAWKIIFCSSLSVSALLFRSLKWHQLLCTFQRRCHYLLITHALIIKPACLFYTFKW